MLEHDTVHHADALVLLASLPDCGVDAVITDPPYGIGLDEWDNPIDIAAFMRECRRVVKSDGFLVFTGQMPTVVDWMLAARETKWNYRDHIAWVKRKATTSMLPLNRSWESVLIYAQGSPKYRQTKGRYEDVKLAGLMTGTITLDSIDRYIKNLRRQLKGYEGKVVEKTNNRHRSHNWMNADGVDRSPEYANFTNVWSFLPENTATLGGVNAHASMKPIKLFERLVELLTDTGALVVDPFAGSGTTAIAARNTGRHYIVGDSSAEYVAVMRERLAKPYTLPMLALETTQGEV